MINWLSQIASVTWFGLCTIPRRKGSAIAAIFGIAGVVAVFVGVLSIAQGFRRAVTSTGRDDIAIVLRDGANNEMSSGLGREETRIIKDAPGVARDNGAAVASAELFVIIDVPKRSSGTDANVPFRGIEPAAPTVRGDVKIMQGRMFERGRNEVIAGVAAAREFAGLDVGKTIKLGRAEWQVVGVFSAGGGVSESELWTDTTVLQEAYQRGDSYQSVYAKLASAGKFQEFKDALTSNPQIKVKVVRQPECPNDGAGGAAGRAQHDVQCRRVARTGNRDVARAGIRRRAGGLLGVNRIPCAGARRWNHRRTRGLSGV